MLMQIVVEVVAWQEDLSSHLNSQLKTLPMYSTVNIVKKFLHRFVSKSDFSSKHRSAPTVLPQKRPYPCMSQAPFWGKIF